MAYFRNIGVWLGNQKTNILRKKNQYPIKFAPTLGL